MLSSIADIVLCVWEGACQNLKNRLLSVEWDRTGNAIQNAGFPQTSYYTQSVPASIEKVGWVYKIDLALNATLKPQIPQAIPAKRSWLNQATPHLRSSTTWETKLASATSPSPTGPLYKNGRTRSMT